MPIGIDVSKLKFNVHFLQKNLNAEFENNPKGFKLFFSWLKKHKVLDSKICMESTGKYSHYLANFLFEKSLCVYVVNPACIKFFANSKIKRIKTDESDAKLIAEFCLERAKELKVWEPLSPEQFELLELDRLKSDLTDDLTRLKNRLEGAHTKESKKKLKSLIKQREKELEEFDKELIKEFDKIETLKENKNLLKTIPGIGEGASKTILLETGNIDRFETGRDLAAYTGVTPSIRQSGTSLKSSGNISRKGNKRLRTILYMPALSAMKHNPIIKKFVDKLKAKGKTGKQIVCAVIRKLIHMIFGVLKNRIPFDPNYVNMQFA